MHRRSTSAQRIGSLQFPSGSWQELRLNGRRLRGRGAGLAFRRFLRRLGVHFADLCPGELYLRAQRFGHRFRSALPARHAAHVGWIASHLLRNAIVDSAAKRGKRPQVRSLIIAVRLVHRNSRCGMSPAFRSRRARITPTSNHLNADGTSTVLYFAIPNLWLKSPPASRHPRASEISLL